ncbi:helix-turn-helix transcriptional regulator [Flavisolibacter nicotianae]|uniref:helix-turn-helix transcriptional regulator n=1 Tax=Flavisolibacter nicotianae TaxID=2364882 RepID=UPI000EB1CAEE|nr:AraC family transcriptional regulator [Flavisolibacter nicotianae]
MNQFVLQQGQSRELQLFPHIIEFATRKNISIELNSLPGTSADFVRIYYIIDGKFEWCIHDQPYILYPGDMAMILPGQTFGNTKGILEIGKLSWLHIHIQKLENGKTQLGNWSNLSESETQMIGKILLMPKTVVLPRLGDAGRIFLSLQNELFNHEIGYCTRVNQLLDELFINVTRRLTKQSTSGRDFPKTFLQLEQKLRENLSHQWTVEEMAATVGMGTTLFNERVKSYSGFSPLNYLINIRISEAIKLLKKPDLNVTDIALDTGFYSSQHFSTTFKKLTGYTPSEFRKRNVSES